MIINKLDTQHQILRLQTGKGREFQVLRQIIYNEENFQDWLRTISARAIYDSVWHRFAHSRTWRQPPNMGDLGSSSFHHSCFVFCIACLSRSHSSDLVQGFTSKHHLQKTAYDSNAFCRMLGHHAFRNYPYWDMGYKHTYRTITLYNWHRFYSSHAGSWSKKNTCH